MAVYKRIYRRYDGELRGRLARLLVVPRYAYKRVFQSRLFLIFFVLCFLVPLGGGLLIYLRHNLSALEMLQIPTEAVLPINATFFATILTIQGSFAFLLTVLVGPGLVSPDLVNNALPLYLSRPFSRWDYLLGKSSVLLILQSCITWLPLFILYLLQTSLDNSGWGWGNLRILAASFVGSVIWIVFLSLLALAVSAWVRWRAIAGALLFGVFIVGTGVGEIIREVFYTRWGELFNLNKVIRVIWDWLFYGDAAADVDVMQGVSLSPIPIWSAWMALTVVCMICFLLLARRVKAYEVVK